MTTPSTIDVEVSRFIAAAPETVYALVSDITQMPRYSPETTDTRWLDGHGGRRWPVPRGQRHRIGAVDDQAGHHRRGPRPRFAFRVPSGARSTWTYGLEAVAGGTQVTESIRTERASRRSSGSFCARPG